MDDQRDYAEEAANRELDREEDESAELATRVEEAVRYMRSVLMGESMVMHALSREAAMTKRAIPVVDAEEALCILIERGWTWAQIARVNS